MNPRESNARTRAARAQGARAALVVATMAVGGMPALAQENGQTPGLAPAHSEPGPLISVLLDGAAEPASRDSAADRLVTLANRPEVARSIIDILEKPPASKDAPQILLAAIARAWDVPGRLSRPLIDLAEQADAARAPGFMGAIAALRTPDSARALVRFLDSTQPPVRAGAAEALVRMTGRDDLGDDSPAWRDWLDHTRGLSMAQWDSLLAEGVWRRSQRLDADRRTMADRLTDGYRQLYLALPATPGDQRAKLLSQMLLGTRPELRDLGFEIVSREVASGKSVDGPVSDAAAELLSSPSASVRAKAAALVMQLTRPSVAPRLVQALVTETDPATASQLLLGLARWPDAAGREPALKWLESDPKVRPAAAEALLALRREGLITSPADQDRIAAALRQMPASELNPAACQLLVAFGDDRDRQTVADLLSAGGAASKTGAAEALVGRPEFVDAILNAAKVDPALFATAARAVSANRATAAGYEQLASLAAPTADDRTRALLETSAALRPTELLDVAKGTEDPAFRQRLLARLTEHGPEPKGGLQPGDPEAISQGIVLLARTDLALKRPDLAAAALDALPRSAAGVDSQELLQLRTVALLWSNRMEDAQQLDAPAAAWIEGLERAIAEPHARAILREIRQRFGGGLTKEQAERVKELAARLSSIGAPADGQAAATEEKQSR